MDPQTNSVFYRHSGRVPLASRISYLARTRMHDHFMRVMQPRPEDRILDVGVTSDSTYRESNFLEQAYPYKDRIVCIGTEDGSHLEQTYPGIRFQRVQSGAGLPFADKSFEIVYSNAVIEHVGDTASQKAFVRECCRVGKRVFITTPNRFFPVEHHTGIPLLHWFPKKLWYRVLRGTRYDYWSQETNLNLLTARQLAALFPSDCRFFVTRVGVGWGVFCSNLIAHI